MTDVRDAMGTVRNSVGTVASVVTAPRAALALGLLRGVQIWRKRRAAQRRRRRPQLRSCKRRIKKGDCDDKVERSGISGQRDVPAGRTGRRARGRRRGAVDGAEDRRGNARGTQLRLQLGSRRGRAPLSRPRRQRDREDRRSVEQKVGSETRPIRTTATASRWATSTSSERLSATHRSEQC